LSCGSSAITVSIPVNTALAAARRCCTRRLASDPLAHAIRQRNAPIETHRDLHDHARHTSGHALLESQIELAHFRFEQSTLHRDAARGELLDAGTAHLWIRIDRATDNARHAGANQRIGAWRRAPVKGVRLESDVRRRTARAVARGPQRTHFGMWLAPLAMPAFADDLLADREHTPDARIRMIAVAPELCELDRTTHHPFIERRGHQRFLPASGPFHNAS
jgi:hypothetical protein